MLLMGTVTKEKNTGFRRNAKRPWGVYMGSYEVWQTYNGIFGNQLKRMNLKLSWLSPRRKRAGKATVIKEGYKD